MEIRQITFTARGQVQLQQISKTWGELAPDEVAGHAVATMISPGTEIQGGLLGNNFPKGSGYTCVINVEQVGEQVTGVKVGDHVFCMNGHADYHRVKQDFLAVLPSTLDPQAACCARFMGVSMSTLTTTIMRPPANVLVMGLGLVGNLACRLFDSCGYNVTGVDLVAGRCEQLADNSRCKALGQVPDTQTMDLVIDCSGHEQAVLDASRTLRKGGELVLIGVPWKRRADIQTYDLLHVIFHRYIHLRGGWEWELPRQRGDFDRASIWSNIQGALNWLDQKRLNVDGIYDVCRPDQCQQAYDRLIKQGDGPLTTVFDWTQ